MDFNLYLVSRTDMVSDKGFKHVCNLQLTFTSKKIGHTIDKICSQLPNCGSRVDLLQVFVFLIGSNLTCMKSLQNPPDGWGTYSLMKYKLLPAPDSGKKSFIPHIIPKTKRLVESLRSGLKLQMWKLCLNNKFDADISYKCF